MNFWTSTDNISHSKLQINLLPESNADGNFWWSHIQQPRKTQTRMQSERGIRPQRPWRRIPRTPWPSKHIHSPHPHLPRKFFHPAIPSYLSHHQRNGCGNQRCLPSLRWPNDCFQQLQHHRTDHRPKNQHCTGQRCPGRPHPRLHRSPS